MELPHSTTGPETSGFTRRVPAMRLGRRLATIAVLGMSGTGQIMVNALKLSGHNVIVYDKDVLQCFRFTPLGIKVASSVRDAFDKADVTFGCVESDQDALEIFEGWCSILFSKSISNRKGYIEMMGVNKIISTNYRDLINSRGGLYLEAQMHGSCLYAAGDLELYEKFLPCFYAMNVLSTNWYKSIGTACLVPCRKSELIRKLSDN